MNRWRLLVVAALLCCAMCVQTGWAANQVTVQSRAVAQGATGVQVGVYVDNDVELYGIVVPLELRQLDPPSYIAGNFSLGTNPAGRIQSSPLMQWTLTKFYGTPEISNTCSGPVSHTWPSGADTPGGTPGFYTGPDAVMWVGLVMVSPGLMPGTDGPVGTGAPSLRMTFDAPSQLGSFEIDTCCTAVENHLGFWDNQTQPFAPQFTKGIIQVVTNQPPVALCHNVLKPVGVPCTPAVAPSEVDAGSYDPEDGTSITRELVPPGPFPLGDTQVKLIVGDQWGAKDTCVATIQVRDVEPPELTCPGEMTVGNDPGQCGAYISFAGLLSAHDNCDAQVQIVSDAPPGAFPVGSTVVRFYAMDEVGLRDTCITNVTVQDAEPPVVQCRADTAIVVVEGQTGAIINYTSSATDNCPGMTLNCSPPSGSTFPLGETNVQCIATDASGNADTCFFKVTVTEYTCFDRLADVNCDGIINVQDVVEAVNVAFRGKPNSEVKPCTTPPLRR